jgi:hypothetical protein
MRFGLPALVSLGAMLALAAPGSAGPGAPAALPRDLKELQDQMRPLPGRLDALLERAEKDHRLPRVEMYAAYKAVDFEDRRREVKAKELLDILKDETADFELRTKVVEALTSPPAKNSDPDLKDARGSSSPRNVVSRDIVRLLDAEQAETRFLANQFLVGMNGKPPDEDILAYDPRVKATWKPAQRAWNKFLR